MKKRIFRKKNSLLALSLIAAMGISSLSPVVSANAATSAAKYYGSFNSMEDAKKAAEQLTEELAAEGDILLKNLDKALPLNGSAWVSVFGVRSDNLIGASDSSGAHNSETASSDSTVADALIQAGFNVNPTLKEFYDNDTSGIGNEVSAFPGQITSSIKLYNDAAIVVLAREGGEGSDASTVKAANGSEEVVGENDTHKALAVNAEGKAVKHSLMLTNSEEALIEYVKEHFDTVIVVLNTSNAMEVAQLQNDDGISAIIDIGRPGVGGLNALAGILNGKYNPSGALVDEWMTDFTTDPTWYNFGSNVQNNHEGYAASNTYRAANDAASIKDDEGYHGVDYEESIYLGYKYYETYYYDLYHGVYNKGVENDATHAAAQKWWKENVTYPFGYGLSYTTFSFKAEGIFTDAACKKSLGSSVAASTFNSAVGKTAKVEKLYVPVTVTNTGDVEGKKIVQLYVTAPYTKGGIEKSAVTLVGFNKTDILQPGESQTIVVEFNVQDMASWDYSDANKDGNKGDYELDAGEYIIRVMENSHFDCATNVKDKTDAYDEVKFTLKATANLKLDDFSHNELANAFSVNNGSWDSGTKDGDLAYNNIRTAEMMADGKSGMTLLSRTDMVATFPKAPTESDLTFKDNILSNWGFWDNYTMSDKSIDGNGNEVKETKALVTDESKYPWYKTKEDIPTTWTQATGVYDEKHPIQNNRTINEVAMYYSLAEESPLKYSAMAGVSYDDPLWDTFLNQLTYDELCAIVEFGGYSTVNIDSVGKAKSEDTDGPNNLDGSHCWCSEDIIASTWNVKLAEKEGALMGDISLLHGTEGWYGPGMDVHRSPFSGRNNEYYAQDGILAGYIAAAVVTGARTKGVITYVKHCFMNDQETNRGNLFTWCDEQAIRENNCKAFQMALQEGQSAAAMTGYGRLGGLSNTNNYNMSTELYQNQWGVNAYFVTDGYIGWAARTDLDMMVRVGNQLELYTTPFVEYLSGSWDTAKGTVVIGTGENAVESYTQWYCVRQSAKAILFQCVNSSVNQNGYTLLDVNGGELVATQGVTFESSVSIAALLDADSSVRMTVEGKLPQGITVDSSTGAVSGKAAEAGEFAFTVKYVIDGYVEKTAAYKLVVSPAFVLDAEGDDLSKAAVGQSLFAQITSSVFTTEGGKYDTVTYKVKSGTLPEGVVLKEDGIIEGTPAVAGTYNAVVQIVASKTTAGQFESSGSTTTTDTNEYALTIVVAGAENQGQPGQTEQPAGDWTENVPYIKDGNWYVNGVDTGVAATATVTVPSAGDDTAQVVTQTGNTNNSGNGAALVVAIIACLGVVALAAYEFIFGKKTARR